MPTREFSPTEALMIGNAVGVDWRQVDPEQFRMGLAVELEHGARDPQTDVTGDDLIATGKIALAHLKELPDYYTRLAVMESAAMPPARGYAPAGGAGLPAQQHPPVRPDLSALAAPSTVFWTGLLTGIGVVSLANWVLDRRGQKSG
jgi:hypothetical protein